MGKDFGVIDIGSNTIRAVIYKDNRPFGDKAHVSHILHFTDDGVLSKEGIDDIIGSLSALKAYLGDIPIYAFATSAMRDVKNFCEVKKTVKDETDIEIELISGEREAEYDYLAIKSVCDEQSGIAVDLGGGSAQVVVFEKDGVEKAESFAIGVKRMRNAFCKNIVPEKSEIFNIEEYVAKELMRIDAKSDYIWFMGGTAKAAEIAAEKLFSATELTPDILDELFIEIIKENDVGKKLFGKRYATMPVGLKVMKKICETLGGKSIKVTEVGVRDGFAQKLMNNL